MLAFGTSKGDGVYDDWGYPKDVPFSEVFGARADCGLGGDYGRAGKEGGDSMTRRTMQWIADRREMVVLPLGIAVWGAVALTTAAVYFVSRY